jgi:hypothetical protein
LFWEEDRENSLDFWIHGNASYQKSVNVWDVITRAVVSLTGWEMLCEIRSTDAPTGTLLYTLSTANGKISLGENPDLGIFTFNFPSADVLNFTWTTGYFDVLYLPEGGDWLWLYSAQAHVAPGVSDPTDYS